MKILTDEPNRPPLLEINLPGFAGTLKQFEGTEYMPSGFTNQESINLLERIDSILQLAGWERVKATDRFGETDPSN